MPMPLAVTAPNKHDSLSELKRRLQDTIQEIDKRLKGEENKFFDYMQVATECWMKVKQHGDW